jgi:hypothetical protein
MKTTFITHLLFAAILMPLVPRVATAGIYSGPTDTTNAIDAAIVKTSPLFVEWANAIDASRTHFAPRGSTTISNTGINSLGDLDATQIAAGVSPGYLTVTFPHGIRNGAGPDFAVFENGFTFGSPNGLFAELAYVRFQPMAPTSPGFPASQRTPHRCKAAAHSRATT